MKHFTALLIKFIMVTLILEIILNMLTELTLTEILYISVAVTVFTYIIGDLLILPASNNIVATLADFALALATIYMFNYLWNTRYISLYDALVSATVIGVGEWFFHIYVNEQVLLSPKKD
jgi:hypothetical protein